MERCARLGLIASYWDFEELPIGVVEDVGLLMAGEAAGGAMEQSRG